MRVVHICQRDDPDIGGSLRVAEALVQNQRETGIDAWILFLYGSASTISRSFAPHAICLELESSREAALGLIRLKRALKKIKPDLIHTHDGLLWPRLVFMMTSVPVVMHAHLPANFPRFSLALYLILKTTHRLIGISRPTILSWVAAGFPEEKISHVQNGVDLHRFRPVSAQQRIQLRAQLNLPNDKKVLLWLGRLHRSMKGADRIERMGAMLPDDTVLVVVGNGPEYEGLVERSKKNVADGRMIIAGSTCTPQDYYKVADAFLFTSHYEPFGLVILEAAASGLPILGFPVDQGGGATQLLKEFDALTISDDAPRSEVLDAVRQVTGRTETSDSGRDRAASNYSWEKKSSEVSAVYQRILHLTPSGIPVKPRVLVCQHGARHRYAIPRMINQMGLLSAFYTDSSAVSLIGKCVRFMGGNAPEAWRSFSRWTIRGVPRSKVYSSDATYYLEVMQRLFLYRAEGIRLYHQRHRVLSARMRHWGLKGADIIYSMYHEDLDFIRWAKARGAVSMVDVFISPLTDKIMTKEAVEFPGWEYGKERETIEFETELWRETAELADLLICPSEWVADGVREVSPACTSKIRVVPYGSSFSYDGMRNEPVPGRILFAGRDALRKGLHYLAMATTQLKGKLPELDVRIAGNLPDEVISDPLCQDLNFLGQLDGPRMKQEYLSADALVLPALSEGFAGVVAEAMSAGCPVIVTREAGSPVKDESEGLIIPSRNSKALAEAMLRMITDREFREQCSVECLKHVPFYSEDAWRERLQDVLTEFTEKTA